MILPTGKVLLDTNAAIASINEESGIELILGTVETTYVPHIHEVDGLTVLTW